MVIDFELNVVDTLISDVVTSDYILLLDSNIVSKTSGVSLWITSDNVRAEKFIQLWGRCEVFYFGLVDCSFDLIENKIEIEIERGLLITRLLTTFFANDYHPLSWIFF